jgi:hypothetical protein
MSMKMTKILAVGCAGLAMLLAGCASPPPDNVERGPHGTVAYYVSVDATAPGARVEANGQYIGNTPLTLKIFGDKDGTFHDFGSYYYVVQALPLATNQYPQVAMFRTGKNFTPEDHVPKSINFDMNQPQPAPAASAPLAAPGAPYYGPPAAYPYPYPYPYPYSYGPAFRFYIGPGYYHHH